jgi:putative holliday junction resolvase
LKNRSARDGTPRHPPAILPHPRTGTVLAFDFGEKRIGIAVGDFETRIAHPLTALAAEDNKARFAAIEALIREWRPVRLVVGLPAHADGTEHETSRLARRFTHRLQGRFGVPAELVDERLTSVAAESALRESGARARSRKAAIDALAAQEILRTLFASRP